MSDDKVIELDASVREFFRHLDDQPAGKPPATPAPAKTEPPPVPPAAEGEGEGEAVAFDKLSLFPRPGDPYAAHSRPFARSVPMLVLLRNDGRRPTFAYGDLRFIDVMPPKRPGNGPGLLLRFLGVGTAELEGVGLDRLHGLLYLHRLAWIRELPAGRLATEDHAVIVTGITVQETGR